MGVTGLWKLIEQSGKPVPLETLEGKVLAIDVSIWLHQMVKGYQDGKGGVVENAHLIGLFNRLCKLLFFRIKPVFVFDGGTPQLKRITIEKRSMQRSKTQHEANRVEQILLETLAKEKIVQQALGKSVKDIISPRKAKQMRENGTKDDDIFALPPLATEMGVSRLPESDDEPEEVQNSNLGDLEINKIDVSHPLFKSLPADKRHAILYELKETRKQSSWGRLHEMPAEGHNFADFQMKRLLKRRNVQVSLEEAELEMGGKSLTLMELDQLMQEDGIVEADLKEKGQRIASNENARFVYIKDTLKAIEEEVPKERIETIPEEDIDLQMAIAMSLQEESENPANLPPKEVTKDSDIKLSTPQRQNLKNVNNINKGIVREYMLEYGNINDDVIQGMFKDDKKTELPETDCISITSSTDSDFIDVPEDDFSSEVLVNPQENFPMPNASPSMEFRIEDLRKSSVVEVKFDANDVKCDDLFADIFEKKSDEAKIEAGLPQKRSLEDEDDDSEKTQPLDLTEYEHILNTSEMSPRKKMKTDATDKYGVEIDHSQLTTQSQELKIEENPLKRTETEVSEFESPPKKICLPKNVQKIPSETILIESDNEPDVSIIKEPEMVQKSDSVVVIIDELTPKKIVQKSDSVVTVDESPKKVAFKSPEKTVINPKVTKLSHPEPMAGSSKSYIPPKIVSLPQPSIDLPADDDELRQMEQELAAKSRSLQKEMNKKDRFAVSVTERMSADCQELLRLFGVPFIVAPMEAEAECAFLNKQGLVDGIISDDSDVWLFGGTCVYKNFFDNKKIVLEYRSESIKNLFHLDQKSLIQLGMLVGSDYTSGIQGIGPVTALEIIAAFSSNDTVDFTDEAMAVISILRKFRDWFHNKESSNFRDLKKKLRKIDIIEGFPNLDVVRAYLYPEVDLNDEPFSWGFPDEKAIQEMTRKKLAFTEAKTNDILGPVLKKLNEKQSQASIKNYFKTKTIQHRQELVLGKRTEKSIRRLAGESTPEREPKKKKRTKKVEVASTSSSQKPEKAGLSPKKPVERKKRQPRIPDPNPEIPQLVKSQKEMEERKKLAAEIFKNSKK